jgi:hypothetical protein
MQLRGVSIKRLLSVIVPRFGWQLPQREVISRKVNLGSGTPYFLNTG